MVFVEFCFRRVRVNLMRKLQPQLVIRLAIRVQLKIPSIFQNISFQGRRVAQQWEINGEDNLIRNWFAAKPGSLIVNAAVLQLDMRSVLDRVPGGSPFMILIFPSISSVRQPKLSLGFAQGIRDNFPWRESSFILFITGGGSNRLRRNFIFDRVGVNNRGRGFANFVLDYGGSRCSFVPEGEPKR